jgi:1,2-phenylacetyl-CoA epoxidase catalytic subunit
VEQPNGNFADTIARQFFIDVWHVALFSRLVSRCAACRHRRQGAERGALPPAL